MGDKGGPSTGAMNPSGVANAREGSSGFESESAPGTAFR
jgi:hypothetical protein